jgi:rfaE bifunctional protein kinase chain/domain
MNHISPARAENILDQARGKRVAVIGDFMLDRHLKGAVRRISPEAPVPVVEVESEVTLLGGAGNVVQNLASLGIKPVALGVIGKDTAGHLLLAHLQQISTDVSGMVSCATRPTTEKTRIIANDQHVVRADRESVADLERAEEDALLDALERALPQLAALIVQDYNKGVLTERVIETAITQASKHRVPVAVDPKFDRFFSYRRTHLFKPNVREVERVLGFRVADDVQILKAGNELFRRLESDQILITRGEKGMTLFLDRDHCEHIPTRAIKVHDVSGAGDTVIAMYVAAECGGAHPVEAAVLANYAAGVVCGEVGVVPIERQRLLSVIGGSEK